MARRTKSKGGTQAAKDQGSGADITRGAPSGKHGHLTTVAIGSSAGGLKPLRTLFQGLPSDLGVAFVIIAHLDPHHPSELVSIISRETDMAVVEVDEKLHIQADHVYVIAPDRQIVATDDEIATLPFDEPRGQRSPIDRFFRSLAERHRDGFAIVLSGAGSDGSIGVRAMKSSGGIVMVQDPVEAEYSSMPRSAINTGCADFVLPVEDLTAKLVELVEARKRISGQDLGATDQDAVRRILAYVRTHTGHDFSNYKSPTILRRLTRRMQLNHREKLEDYLQLLRDDSTEVQNLFGDLLISVTTFFRDPQAFEALGKRVIAELLSRPPESGPLRIWVAGCATGEEVYSIAMLLLEEAAQRETPPEFQIFATDIDSGAIEFAREGLYPLSIEADVSDERLQKFFTREGDHYRVRKNLRDLIVFANHSLLKDPPFSRLDLVSCRNLLIYLESDVQDRVLSTLHYALNPGGYLFLGSAETAGGLPDRFGAVDEPKNRIYMALRRTETRPPLLQQAPNITSVTVPRGRMMPPAPTGKTEAALHRQTLELLAPPSLLVDPSHQVLHISETAGRYLRHPAGSLSSNILQIILPELKLELSRGLRQAFEKNEPSLSKVLAVQFNGTPRRVILQVRPVERDESVAEALVLIIEGDKLQTPEIPEGISKPGDDHVAQLYEELEVAREQVRLSRSEYETMNEELRAANEELQSINEEYRSTSEELETSKEELQSMNEELQTLNAELKSKVENLSSANADLENLIASTEGGTLFLDPELRIRLFTPGVRQHFNIAATDVGRPITDFTHKLAYDGLADDAATVLRELKLIEREIANDRDEWFLLRMRPYRTLEDRVDGVVVSFVDVSQLHHAEEAFQEVNARFRALINASSYVVYRVSPDWKEMRELDGRGFIRDTTEPSVNWLNEYIDPADQPLVKKAIGKAIRSKSLFELEHRVKRPDGSLGWTLSRAIPMMDENGKIIEWFGAASDVTEQRQAQEELARARRIDAIGRLAGGVAHDFNNLLTIILANIELAKMRISDDPTTKLLNRAAGAAELGASFNRRLLSLAGQSQMQPRALNINARVSETCKLLEPALGVDIELTRNMADDLWLTLVDPGEIDSLLLNLLLNARDALPDGGAIFVGTRNVTLDTPDASSSPDARPGDYVCLSVTDTGIGMSQDILAKSTDAFFSTKENETGTGLGLFSVLTFARRSDGFVELESNPGEGTTIRVFLPRTSGDYEKSAAPPETEETAPPGNGETVLVVEDSEALREATRDRLETLGYTVIVAGSAAEAIKRLETDDTVQLVFSDLIMPGEMNGLGLARWMRAEKPEVAVLLSSGYRSKADQVSDTGAQLDVEMLAKPYTLTQLAIAIRDAMTKGNQGGAAG